MKHIYFSVSKLRQSVSKLCQLKFPVTYYMSLLNDDKSLILNVSPSYRMMYYHDNYFSNEKSTVFKMVCDINTLIK